MDTLLKTDFQLRHVAMRPITNVWVAEDSGRPTYEVVSWTAESLKGGRYAASCFYSGDTELIKRDIIRRRTMGYTVMSVLDFDFLDWTARIRNGQLVRSGDRIIIPFGPGSNKLLSCRPLDSKELHGIEALVLTDPFEQLALPEDQVSATARQHLAKQMQRKIDAAYQSAVERRTRMWRHGTPEEKAEVVRSIFEPKPEPPYVGVNTREFLKTQKGWQARNK